MTNDRDRRPAPDVERYEAGPDHPRLPFDDPDSDPFDDPDPDPGDVLEDEAPDVDPDTGDDLAW